jgi:hypothetical protein
MFNRSISYGVAMAMLTIMAYARADEITISVSNDDAQDLFVTVVDLNTANASAVLSDHRLNQGTSIAVRVQSDGNDRAHISWQARRTDSSGCGRKEVSDVANLDTITVDAQNGC